jgi:hypothetical protein
MLYSMSFREAGIQWPKLDMCVVDSVGGEDGNTKENNAETHIQVSKEIM